MSDTEVMTSTNGADWDANFARLKARFPKVRDTILFCMHTLQQNQSIHLDDLKALAELHKLRVTGASLSAARRILDKQPAAPSVDADRDAPSAVTAPRARRPNRSEPPDAEAMIRNVVGRLQRDGDERSGRLRDAIRKAIGLLRAALDS